MDGSSAGVPSGSLDILPDLPPSRRGRKSKDAPPPYVIAPALAPPQPPVVAAPPAAPPTAPVAPPPPPPLPPAPLAAPVQTAPPVFTQPVQAPAAPPMPVQMPQAPPLQAHVPLPVAPPAPVAPPPAQVAAPPPVAAPPIQAAPPAAGVQALKDAFAIDIAERENRHRAELHEQQQAHVLAVNAREDLHRDAVHTLQQTIKDIREQLNHAVSERDHQSQARAGAESELKTHRTAYDTLRSEVDAYRLKLSKTEADKREVDASLAASRQETERWSEEARRAEAERRSAMADAEQRLQTSEDRNVRLAEQTAAHEAAGQQLRTTIAEQRADREKLTGERDVARQHLAEIEAELRTSRYETTLAADELSRSAEAATKRSESVADDPIADDLGPDDLLSPLAEARAELERMRAERDAARRQAAALEAELEGLIDEPRAVDSDEPARSLCESEPLPYPSEGLAADAEQAPAGEEPPAAKSGSDDHPVSLAAEIDLDPWQREALAAWADDAFHGVVEAVTDEGRTRLAHWAIGQALDRGMKVLVVVPSADHIDEWHRNLRDALPINRVTKHTGGKDARLSSYDVVVATAEGAAKGSVFGSHFEGLLVAVDAHAFGTSALSPALDKAYTWRLGLTADYERDDDGIATYLDPYFGGISFRLWYDRALEEQVIGAFDIALVCVQLGAGEQAEYDTCEKQVRDLRTELVDDFGLSARPFAAFQRDVEKLAGGRSGPSRTTARSYQKAAAKRDELVANSTARDAVLRALASRVRSTNGALVFTQTQQAAGHAARVLEGQGCATTQLRAGLLAGAHALHEGDEIPDVDLAILIGACQSKRELIQRLDQVTRDNADDRVGHVVLLYIDGSVEDDLASDEATHITTVTPYAAKVARFDAGETDALLELLAPNTAQSGPRSSKTPELSTSGA